MSGATSAGRPKHAFGTSRVIPADALVTLGTSGSQFSVHPGTCQKYRAKRSGLPTRATADGKSEASDLEATDSKLRKEKMGRAASADFIAQRKASAALRDAKVREAVAKKHELYKQAQQQKKGNATPADAGILADALGEPVQGRPQRKALANAPQDANSPTARQQTTATAQLQAQQDLFQNDAAQQAATLKKVKRIKDSKAAKLHHMARRYSSKPKEVKISEAELRAREQELADKTMMAVRAQLQAQRARTAAKMQHLTALYVSTEEEHRRAREEQEAKTLSDALGRDALRTAAVRAKIRNWKEAKAAKAASAAEWCASLRTRNQQLQEQELARARAAVQQYEADARAAAQLRIQAWKQAKAEKIANSARLLAAAQQQMREAAELQRAEELATAQEIEAATILAVREKVRKQKAFKQARQAQMAAWAAALREEAEQRRAQNEANMMQTESEGEFARS